MKVTFWGVRGSIPAPGPDTVEFGGNTSCLEVRAGDALLIFEGGTGLRLLGKKLVREMPIAAHIFFSHVHRILDVVQCAREKGVNAMMMSTHERALGVAAEFRKDPSLQKDFGVYLLIPYVAK